VVRVDEKAAGNPLKSLLELKPGTYNVQAVLNVYETVHRADGHIVKLHMDQGEGQQWNESPGNLYSKPQKVELGPGSTVTIVLTEVIPPVERAKDTKYLRHISIESKLLTKFWGGRCSSARRSWCRRASTITRSSITRGFYAGTFQRRPLHVQRDSTDASDEGGGSAGRHGYHSTRLDLGALPKMLLVTTEHATPYYDDSYGVNTANTGPYGDALTQELYPRSKSSFAPSASHGARTVWRAQAGGSRSPNRSFIRYFGGAWGFCPDQ